jgi:dihydroorotase
MTNAEYDLLISAGRVVCPATGMDSPGAVAVRDGRIMSSGPDVTGLASKRLEYPDAVLLPGLVDLHAHPALGGSKYGVDPDVHFLLQGVTTVLSQGDAGSSNWLEYRDSVIRASRTRVRLAINLSARGESSSGGCFENLDDVDVEACVGAIERGGKDIWGISVNATKVVCGNNDPREILSRALEAAERTGRPLLYGIREPSQWPLKEQLELLRPGDVLTYCFRGGEYSLVNERGRVNPAARDARQRGILFDIGHGMGSFDFAVAEAAIADGFPPDTISSDQYNRHVGLKPQHNLPRTLSKLIAAGMPESEAFAAVTVRPAEILGLAGEIGTLAVDACADLVVLRFNTDAATLRDVNGVERPGGCWEPVLTVRSGDLIGR